MTTKPEVDEQLWTYVLPLDVALCSRKPVRDRDEFRLLVQRGSL
jgi:hypothetical protein